MQQKKLNPLVIDLTDKFLSAAKSYPRKLGRYSCSQIYRMLEAGKIPWGLPASKYFEPEPVDFDGALRMINGVQTHDLVQKYLPADKNEVKFEYEYKVGDETKFVLVGKVDHLPDDSVWEIKSSEKEMSSSKEYQDHQARLYCTICDRPIAYILQPLIKNDRFILKEIGRVERDDEWFQSEMLRLLNYHERLIELNK